MTQTFVGDTRVVGTWIKAGPCVVTQIKKEAKDGYLAIQLGFGSKRIKNVTLPLKGHLRGVIKDKYAPRFLREIRINEEMSDLKVGNLIGVSDIFAKGDRVNVTGISKGKGFAGVVKRWHFAGGPKTHGQSDRQRAAGAIGQGTSPGRVHKGKKMAGRMGSAKIKVKNLVVLEVSPEEKLLISGPVPGSLGTLVTIEKVSSGTLSKFMVEGRKVISEVVEEVVETGKNPEGEEQSKVGKASEKVE